ncbi:ATP-binding cassette domain-containing protein [Streptomyces sp. MS19]|uniref:ATP-binding cassette domain-containing protein n=1 Tax=Streptomyces sp. MS19 TaxID=3385972 RepID=UPI00399F26DC
MLLESVVLRYGRKGARVLDGVTLDLPPATVTAVVGANGSGKSSLLKVAAGLVRPNSGTVRDRPRRTGYVPERLPADMRLSTRSYLLHMGRLQGVGTATAARRSAELLDRLALDGDPGAPISTLSKGNAQKVALAQALLADPALLVLDEPWSGLDTAAHRTLADCLADRRAAGAAVLLTEHRPGTVTGIADTVHRLAHGRLTDQPPPAPQPAFFHITLAPTPAVPPDAQGEDTLRALPGVHAVRAETSRVHLHVAAAHSDAVLAHTLRRGWTVLAVRPAPDADPGDECP